MGADAVLLSPVFPTRSHPGAPVLGPVRFRLLARAGAHAGHCARRDDRGRRTPPRLAALGGNRRTVVSNRPETNRDS